MFVEPLLKKRRKESYNVRRAPKGDLAVNEVGMDSNSSGGKKS